MFSEINQSPRNKYVLLELWKYNKNEMNVLQIWEIDILNFDYYSYPLSILLRNSGFSTHYLLNSLVEGLNS